MDSIPLNKVIFNIVWPKKIKNSLSNGAQLIFQEQRTILSGALVIGLMSFLSALLGLVRKRLYAGILATGLEYDALVAAFKIPDLIFQIFIAGTLNAAFIPLFSRYIRKDKAVNAWRFASTILNWALILLLSTTILVFFLAPLLVRFLVPGFAVEQQELVVKLMRILLLAPLFLGLSAFVGGVIQSFRRFFLPFFSPVAYNLGAIAGILFFYPLGGIEGMAWGVVLGALLHLLIQLPLLRHLGFRWYFSWRGLGQSLREFSRLALARSLWGLFFQLRELVLVHLASYIGIGAISILDYGVSLVRFPIVILAASIAQASLPSLSAAADQEEEKFRRLFSNALGQLLFLILPASVILIVLKIPVVRLVLGTGRFDWSATVTTSWILALLALSLFAQAGRELIVRAFYALREADLPVVISIFSLSTGLIIAALLLPRLGIRGLALGLTSGSWLEFFLLLFFLLRRIHLPWPYLVGKYSRIFFAAAVMAAAVYFPVQILDQVFIDTTKVVNLVVLVWVVLTFGGSIYLFLTWILGCPEINLFLAMLFKLKSWRETFLAVPKQVKYFFSPEGQWEE